MTSENPTDALNTDSRVVEITRQPVELYKVLKFEGLVGSGGEAKTAVSEGLVIVNGHIETQKRKKIVSGDTIEFAGEKLLIALASNPENLTNRSDTIKPEKVNAVRARPAKKRASIALAKRESKK